jgi:U3 small nucleolar RNA-associated protein 11
MLKELSARLERNRLLRYTEREFEMQRLMMGKGATKKIQGVEKVDGDSDNDEETQDEIDARRGRRRKPTAKVVDEEMYRPRVYKWRLERKR